MDNTIKTSLSPEFDSHKRKAEQHQEAGLWKDALAQCLSALSINPEDWDTYVLMGDILMRLGRWKEASEAFSKALPFMPEVLLLNHKKAVTLERLGKQSEADKCYAYIFAKQTDFEKGHPNDFNIQRQAGGYFFRRQEWQRSMEAYQRAIEIEPNNCWVHINLGRLLAKLDRHRESIAVLEKATFLNPNIGWGHYHLAEVLHDRGQLESASESCRRSLLLMPNHLGSKTLMSNINDRASHYNQVEDIYSLYKALKKVHASNISDLGNATVFLYPDYRETNPYQDLLYSDLPEGIELRSGSIKDALEKSRAGSGKVIFHLHWTSPILARAKSIEDARYLRKQFESNLLKFVLEGGIIIWTIHNTTPHNPTFLEEEISLRKSICALASKIHVHSNRSIPEIEKEFDLPREKVHVIHHGNYIAVSVNYVDRTTARKRFGFKEHDIVFMFLGQIRPYKGLEDLFSAFSQVRGRYENAHLLIAGKPVYPTKLGYVAARAKLLRNVHVYEGAVKDKDLQWFFNTTDVVVLPYKKILTSGSVLNALSFGRPVIAPRVGMIEEIIVESENGFLYETGDIDALTKAMFKYAETSISDRRILFDSSLERARDFSWDGSAKRILEDLTATEKYKDFETETGTVRCKLWDSLRLTHKSAKVAVIILNYQSLNDTEKLIDSLEESIVDDFEIVIVDNRYPGIYFSDLVERFHKHTIIQSPENVGYAAGNNFGLQYAREKDFEFFWILNPDTFVKKDSLEQLLLAASERPDISLYGSVILWGHRPDTVWFGGGSINQQESSIEVFHMYGGLTEDILPIDIYEVDYITGASVFFRSDLLEEIGLIPERYFLYFEETDWCLSARRAGHKLAVVPSSRIYHSKRSQSGSLPTNYYFYYYIRSSVLFMAKFFLNDQKLLERNIRDRFIEPWLLKVKKASSTQYPYFEALSEKAIEHGLAGVVGKVDLSQVLASDSNGALPDYDGPVYEGALTRVDKTNISGWARNIRQPIERVKAQIKIDNEIEVVTVSDIYTETLDKKGLGDGCYGFSLSTPDRLFDGKVHIVEVFVDDVFELPCEVSNTFCFEPKAPQYKGRIDGIKDRKVKGWALDVHNSTSILTVEILDGDSVIATTLCDIERKDLRKAGFKTSLAGFSTPIPLQYCDGDKHLLALRVLGEKTILSKRHVLMSVDNFPMLSIDDNNEDLWCWLHHHREVSMVHSKNRDSSCWKYLLELRQDLQKKFAAASQDARVSIIMPAFNRELTIISAMKSVVSQSYRNWELIVIDDGSSDGTKEAVCSFINEQRNRTVHLITLDNNEGVSRARNAGLAEAKGELVAYLDSDNTWDSDFLSIMAGVMQENVEFSTAYCGDRIWQYYQGNTTLKNSMEVVSKRLGYFNKSLIENRNYIDLNVFIHRRQAYEELGGFKEDMRRLVDWELIVRYTEHFRPKFVPAILANYFMGLCENQITRVENYQDNASKMRKILMGL